jgi:hypothetical protein
VGNLWRQPSSRRSLAFRGEDEPWVLLLVVIIIWNSIQLFVDLVLWRSECLNRESEEQEISFINTGTSHFAESHQIPKGKSLRHSGCHKRDQDWMCSSSAESDHWGGSVSVWYLATTHFVELAKDTQELLRRLWTLWRIWFLRWDVVI